MLRNWRRPRTSQQNCYLERRRRWLHQMSLTDRQLLIDGRKRQPLPSSDRREFKSPSASSRSQMLSPANPSRPRIRRPASWKSSMRFAGHSVCQPAVTASRTGQVNPRRNCNTLATFGQGQSKCSEGAAYLDKGRCGLIRATVLSTNTSRVRRRGSRTTGRGRTAARGQPRRIRCRA